MTPTPRAVKKIGKLLGDLTAEEWANLTLTMLVKMPDEVAELVIKTHTEMRDKKKTMVLLNESVNNLSITERSSI